ncbi:hypothetical protein FB645_003289 [Coemansia sp. IMI 203386]|nr:hypothetical protein FB645_003289 [Coemansia sp. IMI 203386]
MHLKPGNYATKTVAVLATTIAGLSYASLTGSGTITYHDYEGMDANLIVNNPPSCGMPYSELDRTRITAVQLLNTATDCGQCIQVINTNDPSKFVYVLAVDTGGRGLDLSMTAFSQLFNVADGVGAAAWTPVDNSNCAGVWSNLGSDPYDGLKVVAAPPVPDVQYIQPDGPVYSTYPMPIDWALSSPVAAVATPSSTCTQNPAAV